MKVIGYANVYYTLWEVSEPYKKYTSATSFYWETSYHYFQNLSMDFGVAKAKVCHEPYEVDLELRGSSSFTKRNSTSISEASSYQFSFGRMEGNDIRECNDIWQLSRLLEGQDSQIFIIKRRAVYARQRLIELGEMVKYTWFEKQIGDEVTDELGFHIRYNYINVKRSYTTTKSAILMEAEKEALKSKREMFGHYFNEGEKQVLSLKKLEEFWFETIYGRSCVCAYVDDQGRGFKYMGSNPPQFINQEEFTTIKGTVSHGEYRGVQETKLKRITLVK